MSEEGTAMAGQVRLYDSLSRVVRPVDTHNGHLTVYVCGITPYDTTHLGHLFTYAMAAILMRYLESRGVRVTYVQNLPESRRGQAPGVLAGQAGTSNVPPWPSIFWEHR
jgi:L-cysteine:1D-myo-inositol 2-amino-2-deoxy-alpha-D-glucopyranoside ligase